MNKKKENNPILSLTIEDFIMDELCKDDETVLVLMTVTVPQCTNKAWKGFGRFNQFYRDMAKQRLRYARSVLARKARKRLQFTLDHDMVYEPSKLAVSYAVLHNENGYFSLRYDLRVSEDRRTEDVVRYTDNWLLSSGYPLPVPALLPRQKKRLVFNRCRDEIARREQQKPGGFFRAAPALLRRRFKAEQSYITKEGIGLFYALSALAPRREGFVSFDGVLPFPES